MNTCEFLDALRTETIRINTKNARSCWGRGVASYTIELLNTVSDYCKCNGVVPTSAASLKSIMLNGADTWTQYSWGGCSLIYDGDIAATLCTPSELKRTRNGERRPNSREEWLDTQARALTQAAARVSLAYRNMMN